jgi:hypothetical protein
MSLRFTSRPYGGARDARSGVEKLCAKIPQDAMPIATAPQASATPVVIWGQDGKARWALHHRDAWRTLAPFKNPDASTSWRMDGGTVTNPIAWRAR